MHVHVRGAFDKLGWNPSLHSYEITSLAKYGATAILNLDSAPLLYSEEDSGPTKLTHFYQTSIATMWPPAKWSVFSLNHII